MSILKCLHCGTKDSEFHDLFDEVGIELKLDELVKQHFQISVEPHSTDKQVLCDGCINRLIELFDVEELHSGNVNPIIKNEITEFSLLNELPSTNENQLKVKIEVENNCVVYEQNGNDEAYQIRSYNNAIVKVEDCAKVNENSVDIDQIRSKPIEINDYYEIGGAGNLRLKLEVEDGNEFMAREDITGGHDYIDIDTYLNEAIKSNLETLQFKWQTTCEDCVKTFETFEELYKHVRDVHQLMDNDYRCILKNCDTILTGENLLARHLILKHCDLHNLQIYGSCPDCNLRYSNFTVFNKHTCCRILKRRRGMRLYCSLCNITFPSLKRYVFHSQFHSEKRRPKICLICDQSFADIDEFFEHVHYSHEPAGTLACKICDRIFRDQQFFEDHRLLHNQEAVYECTQCQKKFRNKNYLVQHMSSGHESDPKVSCEFCDKIFPNEISHRKHMQMHSLESYVLASVCCNCGMISGERDDLLKHTQDVKTSCYGAVIEEKVITSAFNCEFCSMDFKSKCDLKLHRSTGIHNDGKFWCLTCKKTFKSFKILSNHHIHKKRVNCSTKIAIMRLYMCNAGDCEETYMRWNSLYTHKKRVHRYQVKSVSDSAKSADNKTGKSFICQFCNKSCPTKMSRSVHIARRHNTKNIECQYCKSSYKDQAALEKHINYMHIPIECKLCHKIVKSQRNFDVHERVVHLKDHRYFCAICAKGFYHKSDKEVHEKLHNNKYRCNECDFTTRYMKSLEIHVTSLHNRTYPYQCHICSREFARKHILNMHMKRHDTKKPIIPTNRSRTQKPAIPSLTIYISLDDTGSYNAIYLNSKTASELTQKLIKLPGIYKLGGSHMFHEPSQSVVYISGPSGVHVAITDEVLNNEVENGSLYDMEIQNKKIVLKLIENQQCRDSTFRASQ